MLRGLSAAGRPMAVIVVDNADDPETGAITGRSFGELEISRVIPGTNLGCGGGLEYGEREALKRYPQATHLWIMDDDTEAAPDALEQMLAAMEKEGAAVACPSVVDQNGHINWIPGLLAPAAFSLIQKKDCPPELFHSRIGKSAIRFSWASGVSLLVTKEALLRHGFHRGDFWIRGEDIEFSLRLTYRETGIFVPGAIVTHWCSLEQSTPEALELERKKELSMIRNHAYMAIHLPHARRILRKLPGNIWRFLQKFGFRRFGGAMAAVWQGAVLKHPAGVEPKIFA